MLATFTDWTDGRSVASLGTNHGAQILPFQNWRHFKEAYAPELIERAIFQCNRKVRCCIDPFGGSGTTALACQFLGVEPVTIEVNPFLSDLIAAKLNSYDCDQLASDLGTVVRLSKIYAKSENAFNDILPSTFVEPGKNDRWIFDREVADCIFGYIKGIAELQDEKHQQLFRVLLGGILTQVSNIVVNGKGRRYRKNWEQRRCSSFRVDELFCSIARQAIKDIHRHRNRANLSYQLLHGDCRILLSKIEQKCDIAIFSPPYPNSFDYTDVYNIELWVLGYLKNFNDNKCLRESTLCSHVQVARQYPPHPIYSPTLSFVIERLAECRTKLWDKKLPEMVGGYFADLDLIIRHLKDLLLPKGEVWMVVGDSRYNQIQIETSKILCELSEEIGFDIVLNEAFRSMRASPQQGGNNALAESLIVLKLT